jgi:hypothetical protein
MDEIRLLLNLGPVRQGERVMYNGLPLEVRTINMYSILRNPDLEGILRLPLAELGSLISRPSVKEEPWYPCQPNEYLLLPDGTFGQVLRQTLETVTLKTVGSIAHYASSDFLHCNARNLSRQGYGFAVTFGIDYQHQVISLDKVPAILHEAVTVKLKQTGLGDDVENILVDFKEAGASSLDYLIVVNMSGNAAAAYFRIGRLIQQSCVAVCNREGWVIPFNQITVHQGEGFDFSSLPASDRNSAAQLMMAEGD